MSHISTLLAQRTLDQVSATAAGLTRNGLHQLAQGASAVITRVHPEADPAAARRLFDLGFAPGATVSILRRAPFGGPSVYRVADYEVALRPTEARMIEVSPEPAPQP